MMVQLICLITLLSSTMVVGVEDMMCDGGKECKVQGECQVFLKKKTSLRKLSKGTNEYKEALRDIKKMVCNKKEKKVCCEPDIKDSPSWVPRAANRECGLAEQESFVVGGEDSDLGEFPWTVLLGRKLEGGQQLWYCGGVLVNRWYVLTAAHCKPEVSDTVRLGEWEVTEGDERDCRCPVGTCSGGLENECAPAPEDIQVASTVVHQEYKSYQSGIQANDILLIKLERPVKLGKFISPICLPNNTTQLDRYGEHGTSHSLGKPVVAGWGRTYSSDDFDTEGVPSAIQQKLKMPVVTIAECKQAYNQFTGQNLGEDIKIGDHICAGGEEGKDACKGDSGGPLMGRDGSGPFILVGVVSGGTRYCGIGVPALFTRVSGYISWIIQNMI